MIPVPTIVTSASYVLSENAEMDVETEVAWRPAEVGFVERGNATWLAVKTERGTAIYLLAPPMPADAPAFALLAA